MNRATTLALLDRITAPPATLSDARHVLDVLADLRTIAEQARAKLAALTNAVGNDETPEPAELLPLLDEVMGMLADAEDAVYDETLDAAERIVSHFDRTSR